MRISNQSPSLSLSLTLVLRFHRQNLDFLHRCRQICWRETLGQGLGSETDMYLLLLPSGAELWKCVCVHVCVCQSVSDRWASEGDSKWVSEWTREGREVQKKCVNEWVNACSKEDKTQKDRQKGREERMKINGRQVLGVMRKTCKNIHILCYGESHECESEPEPESLERTLETLQIHQAHEHKVMADKWRWMLKNRSMVAARVYRGVRRGWCQRSAAEPQPPSSSSPGLSLHGRLKIHPLPHLHV